MSTPIVSVASAFARRAESYRTSTAWRGNRVGQTRWSLQRQLRSRRLQLVEQFLNRGRRLVERCLLVRRQGDVDDLFDAVAAELYRHADVEVLQPVFALQVRGAGEDLALVLQDGFDHLYGGCPRRVPGRGLEEVHNLRATVARTIDDGLDTLLRDQFRDGDPGHGGVAGQWNHGVAVAAEDEGVRILHGDIQLHGDESTHAGGVEHAGHADHALARKLRHAARHFAHGVERV